MSEEVTKEVVTETPKVSEDVIKKAQEEAVKTALQEFSKQADEKTRYALEEHNKRIITALKGEEDPSEKNLKLVEKLLEDPSKILHHVKEMTKDELRAEIAAERQVEREDAQKRQEFAQAAVDALDVRPDIRTSKEARKLMDSFFNQTDTSLPAKDRVAQAIRDYDLLMERIDGKSTEERVKAAMTVNTSSSSNASPQEVSYEKRRTDSVQSYLEERKASFAKKSNGNLGRARLV